jgi:hypothetical protein
VIFLKFTVLCSYVVWIKKGYQDEEEPRGSSIIKVKGVARISLNTSNFKTRNFVFPIYMYTFSNVV